MLPITGTERALSAAADVADAAAGPCCNRSLSLSSAVSPAGGFSANLFYNVFLAYHYSKYDTIRDAILTCARKPT